MAAMPVYQTAMSSDVTSFANSMCFAKYKLLWHRIHKHKSVPHKDEHAVNRVFGLQEFLEAYKGVEFTKTPEKYFKYSVKDIQDMLMNVFTQ